jgi:hypothetical protein
LRLYQDLDKPLYSKGLCPFSTEKDLAAAFYPKHGFGHLKSFAFQEACTLGSIFKVVTAYAALESNDNAYHFTMTDQLRWDQSLEGFIVGYDKHGSPIPRFYKGGRLPRSSKKNIGKSMLLKL